MELFELIARESIRDLVQRYNANGDSGRFDPMLELFAEDATMELPNETYRGRAEIRAFLSRTRQVEVITTKGKRVGRTVVWVRVAPRPSDYPCLMGTGACPTERFGPRLHPRYHWVDP